MQKNIREIHHDTILLSDGVRLAYRAWMPADAERNPVPAILEYLPYRKNDGTVGRDEITLPATAEKGYACVRVDIRGTGESDGLFDDEYSEQELSDAEEVIAWLSRQPWCDGNVGMAGISWGGFNALQLAYRQPPALKAIITICSTDDRFNEDIHFAGGCLLNDNLDWAAFFWSYAQARCPDPRLVGDGWKRQWLHRLENMPFLADRWIAQQAKNDYWKHGSVSQDYGRIEIPVYAIGGWADAYRNTVFRLLEHLSCPRKGLIGPWAHKYPNIAYPGPRIDYVSESVRWWDRWLKSIDNGVMDEPRLHYYLMDSAPPRVDYDYRTGCWQGESSWPSPAIVQKRLYLEPGKLSEVPGGQPGMASISSPETVGKAGGKLMVGIGYRKEFPGDQRPDDERSVTFDTPPLEESLNIVGQPVLGLRLSSGRATSNLAVRLCDVRPGGESNLVTYGVLNLAHRDSNEHPEALVPGEWYAIEVKLNHIAYRLPQSHRLRLSISNAYWPLVWPSPRRSALTIDLAASGLKLPQKPVLEPIDNPALEPFDAEPRSNDRELRPCATRKRVEENPETGRLAISTRVDYGRYFHASCETEIDFVTDQSLSIHPDDPTSATSTSWHHVTMRHGEIETALASRYEMTCSESHFFIKAAWRALEGEECIFEKTFDYEIERNLV